MDTRQLAAFCEVVERRSASPRRPQRLGVTQPAVSQQVRALEQRLGTQLLDRSGRRVEPTEAGLRLYRGAQRMLAARGAAARGARGARGAAPAGRSRSAHRPGRRRSSCRCSSASSSARNPELHVALSVSDTQSVVELVADRRLELGIVGAARRHRSVAFEPFFRDEVILVCPPRHPFAGQTIGLDELAERAADRDAAGRRRPADGRGRAAQERPQAARPGRAARARPAGVGAQRRAGAASASRSSRGAPSRPISPPARSPRRGSRGSTSRARSGSRAPPAARAAPPRRRSSRSRRSS